MWWFPLLVLAGGKMNTRWSRVAPLSGVALVVLFVVGVVLSGAEQNSSASPAKVLSWYRLHAGGVKASDYLTGLGVVFGVFFYAYLREHLRTVEKAPLLAAAAFGGAILFAAGGTLGLGSQLALAQNPSRLAPSAAQALNLSQNNLASVAVNAGAAILLLASGLAIPGGGRLPGWTGWLALGAGVLSLVPVPNIGALTAAVWTLVVSTVLYLRQNQWAMVPDPVGSGGHDPARAERAA
jgi:hypothetical protein